MKIRGHETFYIRNGWLRKGIKNIQKNSRIFFDKDVNPCDELGIGTSMVKSLRYWLNAFCIIEEKNDGNQRFVKLTELGQTIDEYDKYFEEEGTYWILHYKLARNSDLATAWYWFFNENIARSFDKEYFVSELKEYLKTQYNYNGSEKTIEDEYNCILKMYVLDSTNKSPEELSCPFSDLRLIERISSKEYRKRTPDRFEINPIILFATICDSNKEDEISISKMLTEPGNVGKVFNLDKSSLFEILEDIQKLGYITILRTAGLDLIKVLERKTLIEGLIDYYSRIME